MIFRNPALPRAQHRNTYAQQQDSANNADLWHRIDNHDGLWSVAVEIRSTVPIKAGQEITVPYGENYWFNRKGVKMTCG